MTKYVLGFAFDSIGNGVVLIQKGHPEWQKGKLNGVGGKINPPLEGRRAAMAREFEEETTVATSPNDWTLFAVMEGTGWKCHCFYLFDTQVFAEAKTATDEPIIKVSSRDSIPNAISNLSWLVPMAKNHRDQKDFVSQVYYK